MNVSKLELATNTKHTNLQKNEKCGGWLVVNGIPYATKDKRQGGVYFLCRCVYCGNVEDYINVQALKRHKANCSGGCRSCVLKKASPVGNASRMWKGVGEMSMAYVHNLKGAANRRNIPFEISPEYMWQLFLNQNRTCKLSGTELSFRPSTNERTGTASLDRIDRRFGYVEGNVQWVHKVINEMKWAKTDEEFVNWCEIVAKHNKE